MGDFRKLKVWQRAQVIAGQAYQLTESFPVEERYGLKAQIRGASCSIPANIAEGCGRNRDREFARFILIALGSANELDSHLVMAQSLGFISAAAAAQILEDTGASPDARRTVPSSGRPVGC